MIVFNLYRHDHNEQASDFDLGDIEFVFCDVPVSTHGNPRLSSMIYVSISDLIDGLLRLSEGGKRFEFVGADSSFVVHFERTKQGIDVRYGKKTFRAIAMYELLESVNSGIDKFQANPLNVLTPGATTAADFNSSRSALKAALNKQ